MRTSMIVVMIVLCNAWTGLAQAGDCTVTGFLFNPDGTPAVTTEVRAIGAVKSGPSLVLTPMALTTDATGFTMFAAPRASTLWISGHAVGLTGSGDVAILIPDGDFASLDVLKQSARPPVSGFTLTSGSNPTLRLSLEDLAIELNAHPTPSPATAESLVGPRAAGPPGEVHVGAGANAPAASGSCLVETEVGLVVNCDIVATRSYRYQFPTTAPNVADAEWISVQTTGDTSAADINLAVTSQPNPGAVRNNLVTSWGYNNDGNGAPILPTEPALSYRLETFYSPTPGHEFMESHLQYQSARGRLLRPLALRIDRNTDAATMALQADDLSYLGPDETQYVKFAPGAVYFVNGTLLISNDNNRPFLQQLNAARTYFVTLAYLDNADRVQLGGGAAATDVVVSGSNLFIGGSGSVRLTNAGGAGLALSTSSGGGAFVTGSSMAADPAPPDSGSWKLYAKDDGSGKTELCVTFSSGLPQCFAKQP